ncbi:MerR family transcriptional regulator [Streptomyces sp. PA5.6]|uniref:transcriptional regulator FtsR n=1 Tax=Streptomyces sp. PA5.6 TaxID=3035651 RepID=UPI003904857C
MLQTPRGGAGNGTAAADRRLMSIGTVLNELRDEFPEVTISKIRFLEAEGLIEPQRTPSGYRKFSPEDVERLGHVLRMQRDHYLPLKVIREHLEALERGERPPLPSLGRQREDGDGPGQDEAEGPTAARVGRDELLAAAEIDEGQLHEWESYGLVAPLPDGGYDAEAVTVASLVVELGRFGIEPRHLRAMKAAAEREAALVDAVVAPLRRHRNPQTRAHAEARTRELAGLTGRLHSALVQTALGVRLP